MGIVIRVAKEADLREIKQLLVKAGITERGIEQNIDNFLVAQSQQQKIVGTVGLEPVGKDAFLRSLVFSSESWNAKIGLDFIELALSYGKQQQYSTIYLLTNASIPFFEHIGFTSIEREEVPEHIRESDHFAQYVDGVTKVLAISTKNL